MEPLAHSSRDNIPVQLYKDHIVNVFNRAEVSANAAASHNASLLARLKAVLLPAAMYHDLGKLLPYNQDILHGRVKAAHLKCHWVAGCGVSNPESGFIIASHHVPLKSLSKFYTSKDTYLQEFCDGGTVAELNKNLDQILATHNEHVTLPLADVHSDIGGTPPSPSLLLRMALSCLVDADHADTAQHYGNSYPSTVVNLRPQERLRQIDEYVKTLPQSDRNANRNAFFSLLRSAVPSGTIAYCDGAVGIGKTTAIMAHGLSVADQLGLRRVFMVQPYTSLLDQTNKVYQCLTLPGETAHEVVTRHHHKLDYKTKDRKQYAVNWYAPFVLTTAVQFFETLTSNHPSALKKLHNVAHSVIIIDEAHTSIPIKLWPLAIQLLRVLQEEWGCYIILASGSMMRFWEFPELKNEQFPSVNLTNIHSDQSLRDSIIEQEKSRIRYRSRPEAITSCEFVNWIHEIEGPRLVVVNTTQIAAAIADMIAKQQGRSRVEHISTMLTPGDRDRTIKTVTDRLQNSNDTNWTLVATSCVECGMNFDFHNGFRQRCSLSSLQQVGGRVDRDGKYKDSVLWDFDLQVDDLINVHPDFTISSEILFDFLEDHNFELDYISPDDITNAARRELIKRNEILKFSSKLLTAESRLYFDDVREMFRVITSDTRVCIVNHDLAEKVRKGEPVESTDLMNDSVQMWYYKLEQCSALPVDNSDDRELYEWVLEYDSFLGCMAGILPKLVLGGDFSLH